MSGIPLISICILTYNHENFIEQAIKSALNQKGDFSYEIIIGVDFSTDNTEFICQKYAVHYKNIKLLTTDHRVGMMNNFLRTANACSGKYVAMLEGDDYWTTPNKLQRQIDFLESNPGFVLCFHNRNHIDGNTVSEKMLCSYGHEKHFIGPEVLFATIHTLTVVFRNILKEHPYPKEFYNLPLYDFALWAFLSLFGKFAYLDFNGATYRLHPNGYYSAAETVSGYRKWMLCQRIISRYFPKNYQKNYRDFILMLNFMITEELRSRGKSQRYYVDLLELFIRSAKYRNCQYVRFYYSHYKTELKNRIKKMLLVDVILK
jgi:glycosyltransferase involved in cell wall biosynthesis